MAINVPPITEISSASAIYPQVSVIIPIKNESEKIVDCLKQLISQKYPQDKLEILVIDGMSDDSTRDIVNDYLISVRQHSSIRMLDNPRGQRASALNIGIAAAKGEVICRIDARTIIPPDYIPKCVETLIRTGADNVGGVVGTLSKTPTQRAIGLAMSHPFGVGNAQFRLGKQSGFVDTVYPGCFRKRVFDKVGLFDEGAPIISEDSDMNQRIRDAGGKVYLSKEIVVYYYPREKLIELWKLYFRYGGSRAGSLLKTGKLTSWRQAVSPLFITILLILIPLSLVGGVFSWILLGLLGLYLCADFVISAYLSGKDHKLRLFPILILVFPIIHFAWGLGFLRRLTQRPKQGQYWRY